MIRLIPLLVSVFFLSTCTPPSKPSVSFYYWKTVFQLTDTERETLEHNTIATLYVRYFDVTLKGNQPTPLSPIVFKEKPLGVNVVPVIYIKNEVMLQKTLDVETLAKNLASLVKQINDQYAIQNQALQIDCDWTLASKAKYFRFIEAVKKVVDIPLSVTIRLHQVKYYKKTGIPPVKTGVLMYYNMDKISNHPSNSIYDHTVAQRYIKSLKDYPLRLVVALPIFSWGVHIRNNKVIALLNKVDANTFSDDANFSMKNFPFFEVDNNVVKMEQYFQKGDRIKIESISPEDIEQMVSELTAHLNQKTSEIIFYDLDEFNLKNYAHDKQFFKKVSGTF